MLNKIIAIDGPAGAGKSTIAKMLAFDIGFEYIDTGAMYRASTLKFLNMGIDINNIEAVKAELSKTNIDFENNIIMLDGVAVEGLIRSSAVNARVSDVAAIGEVRNQMVDKQREIAHGKNVILDGRDIGTIVFPNADYKFYLDASIDERAKRRFIESGEKSGISMEEVKASMSNRDKIDSSRKVGPLKKAEDAIYIDTTNMSIEDVIKTLKDYICK